MYIHVLVYYVYHATYLHIHLFIYIYNHLYIYIIGTEGIGLGQALKSDGRNPKNNKNIHNNDNMIQTNVINMKSLICEYNISSIDFLSIDAEGYDSQVLTGLFPMLGRTYVRYV